MNSTSEQQDAQHLRMTTAPVPGLILSLSVPSIITCIITSVYNMADTFFVAQLGTAAVAAVGVVFSISSVLSALGFWMGTGGSSLVSLYLGAREKEKAHCAASTGFFLALGLGGVIAAGGLLALEPLSACWAAPIPSCPKPRPTPFPSCWPRLSTAPAWRWRSACAPRDKARKAWPDSLQAGF